MHTNDMRMVQLRNSTGLTSDGFLLSRFYLHMQDFDGGWTLQILMFPKVNSSECPPSEHTKQAVIAKLLSHKISHRPSIFPCGGRKERGTRLFPTAVAHNRSIQVHCTTVSSSVNVLVCDF